MQTDSIFSLLPSILLGQLPSLLIELGFAVALLVMVLSRRDALGRARGPAIAGASLLVGLTLFAHLVYAGMHAYTTIGAVPIDHIGSVYAVVGTVFQVLRGVAIILLGLAIIRR